MKASNWVFINVELQGRITAHILLLTLAFILPSCCLSSLQHYSTADSCSDYAPLQTRIPATQPALPIPHLGNWLLLPKDLIFFTHSYWTAPYFTFFQNIPPICHNCTKMSSCPPAFTLTPNSMSSANIITKLRIPSFSL